MASQHPMNIKARYEEYRATADAEPTQNNYALVAKAAMELSRHWEMVAGKAIEMAKFCEENGR